MNTKEATARVLSGVDRAITEYGMMGGGRRWVVGVSGGPDSVVLLHALAGLRVKRGLSLVVAHLDHGQRASSAREAVFVGRFAKELGVAVVTGRMDWSCVSVTASLEQRMRQARYDFFKDVARQAGAGTIAVGHTMDDQAETVLMRLCRGSGLLGMGAILPRREFGRYMVVRPLIGLSRADVMEYLKQNKLSWRRDPSNSDERFFRNKIRARLIPFLEREFNPNIRVALANFASTCGADYEYLERVATQKLDDGCRHSRGQWSMDLRRLRTMDVSVRRIVLRGLIRKAKGDLRTLTFAHVKEMEDLIFARPNLSVVCLPQQMTVTKDNTRLVVQRHPPGRKTTETARRDSKTRLKRKIL